MLEVLSAEAVEAFPIAVMAAVHIAAAVSAEGAAAVHTAVAEALAEEAEAVHIAVAVSAEEAVAAIAVVQAAVAVEFITVADVDKIRTSAFIMC